MIILVEGNEGTGKTTLINEISKRLHCVTVKYPKEVKGTFMMLYYFARSNTTFLLDRGFVSDIVYRMWDKKEGQMSLYQVGKLLGENENNIAIIFCHNRHSFINAKNRGEDYIVNENDHNQIERNFEAVEAILKQFTNVEIYDYDYEYQNINDIMTFIMGENYVD